MSDGLDLLGGLGDIVFDAEELKVQVPAVVFHNDITRAGVVVARLADGADIDDGLLVLADGVDAAAQFARGVEVGLVGEDTRDMGVPDDGEALDAVEDGLHLVRRGHGVIGEDVFVDGSAGRAVDGEDGERVAAVADLLGDADAERSEEPEARLAFGLVGLGVELLAGPVGGGGGGGVEVRGLVEHPEVVVAHEGPRAALGDDIHTFEGFGPVPDDVAQADDAVDGPLVDIAEDGAERFGVAVNVADDGGPQRRDSFRAILARVLSPPCGAHIPRAIGAGRSKAGMLQPRARMSNGARRHAS